MHFYQLQQCSAVLAVHGLLIQTLVVASEQHHPRCIYYREQRFPHTLLMMRNKMNKVAGATIILATVRFSFDLAQHNFTPKFCLSIFKVENLYFHFLSLVFQFIYVQT